MQPAHTAHRASQRGRHLNQKEIYQSSLDTRKPQNPTKSEEYQRHLQGFPGASSVCNSVRRGSGGGQEGVRRGVVASIAVCKRPPERMDRARGSERKEVGGRRVRTCADMSFVLLASVAVRGRGGGSHR
eukprot:1189887-Prorocentrum_minimum.AAC.2